MTKKIDFKQEMKDLLQQSSRRFVEVDVPEMRNVMVDGTGDPNRSRL